MHQHCPSDAASKRKGGRRGERPHWIYATRLVVANAGVIATPPIIASRGLSPPEQPKAIVSSVEIRAIHPDPNAIAEHSVTVEVVEFVVVMVAHGYVLFVVVMPVFPPFQLFSANLSRPLTLGPLLKLCFEKLRVPGMSPPAILPVLK